MPALKNLKKLYGRSKRGHRNREYAKLTITTETMDWVRRTVEWKRGGEGSAFFELSVRMMLALLAPPSGDITGDDMEYLAVELEYAVDSPYFRDNIEKLARLLKT